MSRMPLATLSKPTLPIHVLARSGVAACTDIGQHLLGSAPIQWLMAAKILAPDTTAACTSAKITTNE